MSLKLNLRKRNLENLCYIHRDLLLKIMKGENAYKLFEYKRRMQLIEDGVLTIRYGYIHLSEETVKELLRIME